MQTAAEQLVGNRNAMFVLNNENDALKEEDDDDGHKPEKNKASEASPTPPTLLMAKWSAWPTTFKAPPSRRKKRPN